MLAGKAVLADVQFPVLASPKLDGVRILMVGGKALTRTFKPIPNIVIKSDYRNLDSKGGDLPDEFNLGIGFVF